MTNLNVVDDLNLLIEARQGARLLGLSFPRDDGPELSDDSTGAPVIGGGAEIELRCGNAALIMSADGRIQLRDTYITSYTSETELILGGSVNFQRTLLTMSGSSH
ncbi:hypothetical protein [Massilia aquatica]|uniref:Sporulation protein n=1 Tax=Massilia aquatica TaxID=2609000 RepID=A0ABX0MI48_9BURK|nr:hypothetical protein [Massilia aquatica]NHZ44602.1 hypothetical protein [Massilia aquatica]